MVLAHVVRSWREQSVEPLNADPNLSQWIGGVSIFVEGY
jgi:hypothetical protein